MCTHPDAAGRQPVGEVRFLLFGGCLLGHLCTSCIRACLLALCVFFVSGMEASLERHVGRHVGRQSVVAGDR